MPFWNSGNSSEAKTNFIDIKGPVGMKSTSRKAASKVLAPAAALNSGSLSGPVVLVEVPVLWFELSCSHHAKAGGASLVKEEALPVERMTPVSAGVTPGVMVSPSE